MNMLAYHNDPAIKREYLARVREHQKADQIIHGTYWERGKGCAVGCTIHGRDHGKYETELGIPRMLARLEDRIFEGLPNGVSKKFPAQFLLAIKPGADLRTVGWKFLYWLLTEELSGRDDPRVSKQIKACADVLVPLTKGIELTPYQIEQAKKARNADAAYAAYAAADAAYAAYAAADAAYAAYAAAADAAYADAYAAAADAAYAAYAAADAAAYAAYATTYAAADAADAAKSKCYERMAKKLIALLKEAV